MCRSVLLNCLPLCSGQLCICVRLCRYIIIFISGSNTVIVTSFVVITSIITTAIFDLVICLTIFTVTALFFCFFTILIMPFLFIVVKDGVLRCQIKQAFAIDLKKSRHHVLVNCIGHVEHLNISHQRILQHRGLLYQLNTVTREIINRLLRSGHAVNVLLKARVGRLVMTWFVPQQLC